MSTSTHTIQVTFTSRNVVTLLLQLHNVVKSRLITHAIDKNVINIGYTRWCTTWLVCIWRINLSIIMCVYIYIRFNHVYPLVIQHHGKSLFLMGTCGCKRTSFKKKNAQNKLIANWFHCVDLHLLSKTSYSNQCIYFAGYYPASNGQTHDRTIYHAVMNCGNPHLFFISKIPKSSAGHHSSTWWPHQFILIWWLWTSLSIVHLTKMV